MDINAVLKLALPLIAMLVSYAIQQGHFSDQTNTTIASVTVIIAAAASLFLQGRLTGNVYGDFLLVTSSSVALQAEAFGPLQQYLKGNFPTKSNPVPPSSGGGLGF